MDYFKILDEHFWIPVSLLIFGVTLLIWLIKCRKIAERNKYCKDLAKRVIAQAPPKMEKVRVPFGGMEIDAVDYLSSSSIDLIELNDGYDEEEHFEHKLNVDNFN